MLVTYAQWAYVGSYAHFCVDSKKFFIPKRGPPGYYSERRDQAEVDPSSRRKV